MRTNMNKERPHAIVVMSPVHEMETTTWKKPMLFCWLVRKNARPEHQNTGLSKLAIMCELGPCPQSPFRESGSKTNVIILFTVFTFLYTISLELWGRRVA